MLLRALKILQLVSHVSWNRTLISLNAVPDLLHSGNTSIFCLAVTNACQKLIDTEPSITYYDTVAGDGDCGVTLARGAAAILEWIPSVKAGSDAVGTILGLTEVIESNMDGTSGAIYSIFFAALASALRSIPLNPQALNSKLWGEVATKALVQLQLATPARQGDRTLMDALEPFIHSISSGCNLQTAALAAKFGAEATKGMPAAFGRAVYVDDNASKEVPDPGAIGVVCIAEGLAGL
jgi:dihydroxyacetone kinase